MNGFQDLARVAGLHEAVLPLVIAVPRMLGFVVGMQLLPSSIFPTLVRNALAIGLSLAVLPLTPAHMATVEDGLGLGTTMIKEVFVGLALGYLIGLPITVFESLGVLLDTQTGQNSAATYDPISEHEVGPTGTLLRLWATTAFLVSGLFGTALGLVYASYSVWPVDAITPRFDLLAGAPLLQMSIAFLRQVLMLSFPIVLCLLALELSVGYLNRVVPQLNVFTVTMPLKASVALFLLMIELTLMTEDFMKLLEAPISTLRLWFRRN